MSNDDIIIEAKNNITISYFSIYKIKGWNNRWTCISWNVWNVVEISLESAPKFIGNPSDPDLDRNTVPDIIEYYKYSTSIMQIKGNFKHSNLFDFPKVVTSII